MKNLFIVGMVSASLFLTSAYAGDTVVPDNSMQMGTVIKKLQAGGYKVIQEVEYDNGNYKANVLDQNGRKLHLEVNAKSGDIVAPPKDKIPSMSMSDAVKKIEAAGYKNIYKIKLEENKFEAGAMNAEGKKVDLKLNAKTGEISTEWF